MSDRGPPAWWPASVTTLAHHVRSGAVAGDAPTAGASAAGRRRRPACPRVVAVLQVRGARDVGATAHGSGSSSSRPPAPCCSRWRGSRPWSSSRPHGRPASSTLAVRGGRRRAGTCVVDHLEDRAHRRAAATRRCGARSMASFGTTRSPVAPVVEDVAQHPVPPGPEPGEDRGVVGQRDARELRRPRRRAARRPRRSAGARRAAPRSRPGAAGRRSGRRPTGCRPPARRARARTSRYGVSGGAVQRSALRVDADRPSATPASGRQGRADVHEPGVLVDVARAAATPAPRQDQRCAGLDDVERAVLARRGRPRRGTSAAGCARRRGRGCGRVGEQRQDALGRRTGRRCARWAATGRPPRARTAGRPSGPRRPPGRAPCEHLVPAVGVQPHPAAVVGHAAPCGPVRRPRTRARGRRRGRARRRSAPPRRVRAGLGPWSRWEP